VRAKVCVVDWNGDGRLDLLVGDFGGIYGTRPSLSEQDQTIEQEANRRMQELQKQMQPFYDEYAKRLKVSAKAVNSAQGKRERQQKAQEVLNQKEFQALQKQMQQVTETVRKFRRPPLHQGHVWLYLRKPPTAAAK
jgi:hypothetical protein